jgi:Kdo2-lipid IVA lauroyltransferase/acyltransferase
MIAALARGVLRALAALPLRTAQRVGALGGALAWLGRARSASIAVANLHAAMPERPAVEVRRLARASVISTGRLAAEAGAVWCWPARRWRTLVASVEGDDLIEQAQQLNKGVLVLSPHFGNWEVLNLYLGERFGLTVMYDPPRIAPLDPLVRAARMRAGSELVPTTSAGVRALYSALKRGRIVGILPDQVPRPAAGVYANFFGRPALTMTLAARIMRKARPIVIVGTARRVAPGAGFALRFEPLDYDPAADDVQLATTINAAIETIVRRHPDQYLWIYRRFKRPPAGVPRLY